MWSKFTRNLVIHPVKAGEVYTIHDGLPSSPSRILPGNIAAMNRSILWALLFVFGGAAPFAAAIDAPAKISAEERKKIDAVVADYRRAKEQSEKLKQIEAAATTNLVALNTIDMIVTRELNAALQRYRPQVSRAATLAYAKRLDNDALPEIEALRKTVLDQARGDAELTKEMIVSKSDPALQRLREIILLDRATVVDQNPGLLKSREILTPIGERWQRVRELQAKLASETPKTDGGSQEAATPPNFTAYLVADEEQIVGLALPMSQETRINFAINAAYENKIDPEEYRCILALNLTRTLLGLNSLAIDPNLMLAARDHSSDMVKHKFFSHESPVTNKKSFGDRAKLFGTDASAENIAVGTADGIKTNVQWWHSPGHHKNLLGDYKRVGVGREERHWTEMLGK